MNTPLAAQAQPADAADFPASVLRGLNSAQRAAASHGSGPLLIVAGAGTGKTQTLAHRVAESQARPTDDLTTETAPVLATTASIRAGVRAMWE